MNTAQIKHKWSEVLEQPFDLDRILDLHTRYQEALQLDAEHAALYDEQRAIVYAEREAARTAKRAELGSLSKTALMNMLGITEARLWTKERLIDTLADDAASHVEHEHSRVRRIWQARYSEAR